MSSTVSATAPAPAPQQQSGVTVIVPARNERTGLPLLIASIQAQTVAPQEVVVADGMSQDGTREWLGTAAAEHSWLVAVDNPDRTISAALNRAIDAATCPLVARMDAHATYAPDYLERIITVFSTRPEVVAAGGMMATEGRGAWGKAIASVLRRKFGMGGASHRVQGPGGPVDHTFSPAYRRRAVIEVGGFDESMLANEDFELDQRLREAGGVIWLEPSAECTWYTRESPRALATQMFRYGYYKGRTLWLFPESLRLRQTAPPLLLVSLLLLSTAAPRKGAAATAGYLIAAGALGARAAATDGASPPRAAAVVPLVHLSWAVGLLAGLWKHRHARQERRLGRFAKR